jgi:hypothetical protein
VTIDVQEDSVKSKLISACAASLAVCWRASILHAQVENPCLSNVPVGFSKTVVEAVALQIPGGAGNICIDDQIHVSRICAPNNNQIVSFDEI